MQKMKYKCEKCNSKEVDFKYQKKNDIYILKCLECKNETIINPTPEEKEKIDYKIRYYRAYTGIVVFLGCVLGSMLGELIGVVINYYKGL